VANRPYELGLISKYNKYTLERGKMGRCAHQNGTVKAFSQLEIANYRTLSTTKFGLHCSSDITFGGQSLGLPNLKLTKLKNRAFWLKSLNLMPAKFSCYMVLRGIYFCSVHSNTSPFNKLSSFIAREHFHN